QTPVGRHIPDFVSFVHRLAIEVVNADESAAVTADRAARGEWLEARGYRVVTMAAGDITAGLPPLLDALAETVRAER
ncbi:MAG: DUF559 domain-containing protein, partial [Xanthobacteraceae bacterium]